jgi:hypothetical protein
MEVLYTGKLVDRKGYIGVCQAPWYVMDDIKNGNTDLPTLLAYCQAIQPVGSEAVEIKYTPTLRNMIGSISAGENNVGTDNVLMVVAIGVDPNQFVVKFTAVYEYVPKLRWGCPRRVPPSRTRLAHRSALLPHWTVWAFGGTMLAVPPLPHTGLAVTWYTLRARARVWRLPQSARRAHYVLPPCRCWP